MRWTPRDSAAARAIRCREVSWSVSRAASRSRSVRARRSARKLALMVRSVSRRAPRMLAQIVSHVTAPVTVTDAMTSQNGNTSVGVAHTTRRTTSHHCSGMLEHYRPWFGGPALLVRHRATGPRPSATFSASTSSDSVMVVSAVGTSSKPLKGGLRLRLRGVCSHRMGTLSERPHTVTVPFGSFHSFVPAMRRDHPEPRHFTWRRSGGRLRDSRLGGDTSANQVASGCDQHRL